MTLSALSTHAALLSARVKHHSIRFNPAYDLGRKVSERINHLKAAVGADIEMGSLFLCEVDAFTYESTDVHEMNVTSYRGKIVTSTVCAIFLEFLHCLPP
jgi:hypothetical protein